MDGQGNLFAQGLHQLICGVGFAEASHVLDAEKMGAELFHLFGQGQVIVQTILGAAGIEEITSVADGRLANGTGFEHRVDGSAHIFDGVQRIENAEDVDSLRMRFTNEFRNHIIGIGGVADGVGSPEEHLETDIGNAFAQLPQALPGVFVKETQGGVKGGAAPNFEAEELRETMRDSGSSGQQVVGAHSGGQQGLVRVAKRGVREQKALFGAGPLGERARPQLTEQLPSARGGFSLFKFRDGRIPERLRNFLALDLGVTVQNYIAKVEQELGGAVAPAWEVEEFGGVVEERSGDLAGAETRMIDHIFDKGDVGLHAANAEFAKRAVHAM